MNNRHHCTEDRDVHGSLCCRIPASIWVGVYAKTPLTKAALYRMITVALIWFLWTAFFDAAEAKPLGITLLVPPWTAIDPIVIALPISLAIMIHR